MLTLIFPIIGIIITTLLTPNNKLWPTIILQTNLTLFLSAILVSNPNNTWNWTNINWSLGIDNINSPLIILSLWLFPVSLLASIGHLSNTSNNEKQLFINTTLIILTALIITFSASDLLILFLGFETTIIPTLLLITRWGNQQERIEAGYYFVFYTLLSSLPLFIALITVYNINNHLSINLALLNGLNPTTNLIIPIFCLIAFLVKVPIFGVHLWLPKAHVEAPVAGSMILAAILLKLGGYGFIRLISIFPNTFSTNLAPILIPYCCWGGALTSLICLTQTDLKSLIAYSSVSHMSFMIAGISLTTTWAITSGLLMMIAHGIASSALFSIANIYYERTTTRTLSVSRGIKNTILLLPLFWLIFSCANLGLPPLPNCIAEILVFTSIINFNIINIITIISTLIITAIFSLTIYQLLNSGNAFNWNLTNTNINEREYILLTLHLLPLLALIFNPNLMSP
uniref:NADH-ubiquinone oxidoreductase chain 4 n=1 Tax=Ophiotreta durbanensis TaxID=3135534 RepID=A0AAU6PX04_9ECHI